MYSTNNTYKAMDLTANIVGIGFIITALILSITILLLALVSSHKNDYPMTTVVVDVSQATDRVTVKDTNGNLWQFDGAEDWSVGDIASCIVNNNRTEEIADDEIIKVRYNGTMEDFN